MSESSKIIPSFPPRFASKCDRQSSDLTQITNGYNFAVKPTTNHSSSSCSILHLRKFMALSERKFNDMKL